MKGVGKKDILLSKLHFLRYSTGESDMILEFIFCRPIIKILIYHFTISYLVIGPFSEISGIFQEISRKFLRIFPIPHTHPPTLCTHPYPSTPYPYTFRYNPPTPNFNSIFLHYAIYVKVCLFFLTPSISNNTIIPVISR